MKIIKAGYQGILLPDLNIEFDCSGTTRGHTFISHAHSDHMPGSSQSRVYCTPFTHKLMLKRGFNGTAEVVKFGDAVETENACITPYPAGHILGSAMFFVESDSGSVLYTGDYRTPLSPASEGFALPDRQVDHLITEATFALPIYKWKSHEVLSSEIQNFAFSSLQDGFTPIFLAYSLGKAQEVMQMLAPIGQTVQIPKEGHKLCEVYEQAGFNLGKYELYNPQTCEGKILITTNHALNNGFAPGVTKKRIAYCSGWAAGTANYIRHPIDKPIALSDHLDFFELIELCKTLDPEKVHITHTPDASVVQHYLDNLGIDSCFLD